MGNPQQVLGGLRAGGVQTKDEGDIPSTTLCGTGVVGFTGSSTWYHGLIPADLTLPRLTITQLPDVGRWPMSGGGGGCARQIRSTIGCQILSSARWPDTP